MKAFLDTSVLVAVFYADHEHHIPSLNLLLRYPKKDVGCGAHSLAEVYATLTSMPGKRRVSGQEAMLFLGDIRERLTLITLEGQEYFELLESAAAMQLGGGHIFDAILGQCALKSRATTIYTWNSRDFLRLPPAIASRVKRPDHQ